MVCEPLVRVQREAFDAGVEIERLRAGNPRVGAIACFLGLVRDVGASAGVKALTLDHYPAMTEKTIREIVEQARARWDILDAAVIHRIGRLRPTDPIVLVVVAAGHRHDAFEACAFVMDGLKTRAPFWKKEQTPSGERWVQARAADEAALTRWGSGLSQRNDSTRCDRR